LKIRGLSLFEKAFSMVGLKVVPKLSDFQIPIDPVIMKDEETREWVPISSRLIEDLLRAKNTKQPPTYQNPDF